MAVQGNHVDPSCEASDLPQGPTCKGMNPEFVSRDQLVQEMREHYVEWCSRLSDSSRHNTGWKAGFAEALSLVSKVDWAIEQEQAALGIASEAGTTAALKLLGSLQDRLAEKDFVSAKLLLERLVGLANTE